MQTETRLDEPPAPDGRAMGKRAVWILGDQVLSSLSNAGLTIVVARSVSSTEYGAFAIAIALYGLVIGIEQALAGQAMIIRYSDAGPAARRIAGSASTGLALLVGAVPAVGVLLFAPFASSPLRGVLVVMALALPMLMLQESWRSVFVAGAEPRSSFLNDLVWVLVQFVGVAILLVSGVDHAFAFMIVWSAGATIAAFYGSRQAGFRPEVRRARWFLANHREVNVPALANTLAVAGCTQIAFLLLATIGGVRDVGALRGAFTLLGPLSLIGYALGSFVVPELIRSSMSYKRLITTAVMMDVGGLLVVGAWGAILLLLPDHYGRKILGDSWDGARKALPGLTLYMATVFAAGGPITVLRAMNRTRLVFWTSVVIGPSTIIGSVLGLTTGGVAWAAWGFGIGGALAVPLAWYLLFGAAKLGRLVTDIPIADPPNFDPLDFDPPHFGPPTFDPPAVDPQSHVLQSHVLPTFDRYGLESPGLEPPRVDPPSFRPPSGDA